MTVLIAIALGGLGYVADLTFGETIMMMLLSPLIVWACFMFLVAFGIVVGWIFLAISYALGVIFFWLIVAAIAAVVMSIFGLA